MKKLLFITILIPSLLMAQELNKKYSNQAYPYHGLSFKSVKAEEFNNTLIKSSCFYQEWRKGDEEVVKDIFPDGMTGVVFKNCNLDNVYVPLGNTMIECTNKKVKVQNDWDDWILDESLNPVEPINKEVRQEYGVSIDPNDIPSKELTEEERDAFEKSFSPSPAIAP